MMLKNKFLSASILSGIFIGTSFIPFPPWASVFAFVPLWSYWLHETSTKRVFWSGWVTQFLLTLIGFNWIIITIHDFGGMPWPIAALGLIAFCSFATIYIPISGVLFSLIRKKIQLSALQSILLMATLLALLEPLVKTIFPWNFGYTLMTLPLPTYQIAEWIGFEGLSSIIIFLNTISFCIFYPISKSINKLTGTLLFVVIVSTLTITGYFIKTNLSQNEKSVKVGIVQANIGNLEEQYKIYGMGFRGKIIDQYLKLSKAEKEKNNPDIIIWPETAAPTQLGPNISNHFNKKLKSNLIESDISLIAGTYTKASTGQTSNSVVFIDKDQFVGPSYSKTHLLAFGEYIPGSQLYPKVKTWLPQISDFKAGNGPQTTLFKDIKFGIQICYESLFPRFSTELASLGSEVIVNVTNDSWYGTYMEPYQHMYMTLARAIEVRRPLIRSTNTGISTVVLADGTILEQSPMNKVWSNTYDVPYTSNLKQTFYSKYTNLGFYLKLLLLIGLITIGAKQRKKL